MTTFRGELAQPYDIDWTNPDTDELLTCQIDDGITVTNVITGVTGETFDAANQIGVTDGTYRVGATWTTKPVGIDSDPYSLFQTIEDVNQEYALALNGTDQWVSFDPITITGDYSVKRKVLMKDFLNRTLFGSDTGQVTWRFNNSTQMRIKTESTNAIVIDLNSALVVDTWYEIEIKRTGLTYEVWVDGVLFGTNTVGSANTFIINRIGQKGDIHFFSGSDSTIQITDFVDSSNSRYWEFNQTKGDTVIDHYNGAIATLNNYPADSGYVRGDDEAVVGYQTSGITYAMAEDLLLGCTELTLKLKLWLNPDHTAGSYFLSWSSTSRGLSITPTRVYVATRYSTLDWAQAYELPAELLPLDYSEPHILEVYENQTNRARTIILDGVVVTDNNLATDPTLDFNRLTFGTRGDSVGATAPLFIAEAEVTNHTQGKSHFYDFTTGDQEKIIDTVGNNHATIVNDSVVKWQPVLPVSVYTVGSDPKWDYADTATWYGANNNGDYHYKLLMHDLEPNGFTTSLNKLTKGMTFTAAKGLEPINNVAQVGFTGVLRNSSLGDNFYYNIGAQNFNVEGSSTVIDSCVVDGLNSTSIDGITPNSGKVTVKNTLIKNCNDGAYNNKIPVEDLVIIDSIIENSNRYATVTATLINTILKDNTNDPLASVTDYCATTKGTLAGTGNIVNAQASWFDANTQITTGGQTALAGKGWNGSDIASWAYDIDTSDPTTPISKSINVIWTKDAQTTISKTINSVWSKVKYLQTSVTNLWSKSSETIISKDLTILWSKVKSVVKSTTNSWSKFEYISKDVNVTWSKVEVVNKPITNNWSKTKQLSKDVNVTWSKTKQVNTTVVNLWSKDATISQQTTVVWSKTKTVSKSTNNSWSKTKTIDKPLTTRWSKLGLDLVKQITTSWSKVEVVNKPITNNWSKVEVVNRPITNNWSKTKQLSKDVNVTWSKISQSSIIKLINVIWSKVESISSNIISSWSKTKTISKSTNISWSKTKTISKDYNVTWSKVESISKDTTNSWSKVKTISKQTQNSWSKGVYSYYTKPLNVSWSKSKNLNVNVKVTWSKDFTRISKPSKLRTYTIPHTNRTFTISYESRKLIIKG